MADAAVEVATVVAEAKAVVAVVAAKVETVAIAAIKQITRRDARTACIKHTCINSCVIWIVQMLNGQPNKI